MLNREELLDALDGTDEEFSIPIMVATQPSYPMRYFIERAEVVRDENGKKIIVLVAGEQNYLPGFISEAIGWQ